ncbi:DNA mismatch repair protein MutL [Clostridia bacterium]|nr:DNA mismatch repair protein MutL [Clostridia bacterium]
MGKIQTLPPLVSDLIAAGEVVERPAAAAKELIENAIDAGATIVITEIARGGTALLRVTDDGAGMSPDDAQRAFLRHATSKIRTAEDLRAIKTLGFRGEALAAISAVSRVTLTTREVSAEMGTAVEIEGGTVIDTHEAGCPAGTTIVIRDLFFNTPARQKFLKKDNTEAAQVQGVVVRAAQSRPDISFVFIADGREVLRTPGSGDLLDCLRNLWGRDAAKTVMKLSSGREGCTLSGYAGKPELTRGSRNQQNFFVNGRPIRSGALSTALENAFKHSVTVGRYPVCSLHVKMPEELYDVNVHPSKLEVKFVYERTMYELVYAAARDALMGDLPAPEYVPAALPVAPPKAEPAEYKPAAQTGPAPVSYAQTQMGVVAMESPKEETAPRMKTAETPQIAEPYRYVGEVLGGYLIVEQGDAILLIDKHAAHERFLFDRLKANAGAPMEQTLITPVIVKLAAEDCDILGENEELLHSFGLSVDLFGANSLAVRSLPDGVAADDAAALLSELAERLRSSRADDRRDAVLQGVACKAAVKVGRRFSAEEALQVVRWVMEDGIRNCPHGRPVAVKLPLSEIARRFLR